MRGRAFLVLLVCALTASCAGGDRAEHAAYCELEEHSPPRPEGLVVAGSGTCLAPLRHVAELYERRFAGQRVHVAQSIGTKGAIHALTDRAIDVGLASRPLTAEEKALGIVEHPLGRVALAPAVHESLPREEISSAELARIYRGEVRAWSDGTLVVPILRQRGDSITRAIEASSSELEAAMHAARESGRALTRYTDQDLRDTVLRVPGAIGFLDAGTIALEGLPLKALKLDGTAPDAHAVRSGRYPLTLTLSVLTRRDASEEAKRLVAFLASPQVATQLESAGYAVPGPPGREDD